MSEAGRPTALTVAGSDSSGGAGIQADLRTFEALGVHAVSAITAVTAQNDLEVMHIHEIPPGIVAAQIAAAAADRSIASVKTGMLPNPLIVEAVAAALKASATARVVVDPVIVSSSGRQLASTQAVGTVADLLFPMAEIVTPNLYEAEVLTETQVRTVQDMMAAAKVLKDFGPRYVVVTGGHLEDDPTDLFYDGASFFEIKGPRIRNRMRGTGCAFSAAIAAALARGTPAYEAVVQAKGLVSELLWSRNRD